MREQELSVIAGVDETLSWRHLMSLGQFLFAVQFMTNIGCIAFPNMSIKSSVNSSTFVRTAWRSLHHSAKRKKYNPPAYRCFSCTIRHLQKAENKFEDGRTTHFGFKTISEAQKEQKGNFDSRLARLVYPDREFQLVQSSPRSRPRMIP